MLLGSKQKIISFLLVLSILFTYPIINSSPLNTSTYTSVSVDEVKNIFGNSINEFLADRGFPGAVVSIYKEGQQLINECFGTCEDPNKVYPLASVSKLFTEAAVNQLIDKNVINKDTKVLEFLDIDFAVRDRRVKQITIEQLLNHTGGWDRDLTQDPLFSLDKIPQSINTNEAFLEFVLKNYRLDHAPGKVESYSNFGYFLLGQVVEKATGQKFVDHINTEFAQPHNIQVFQAETPKAYSKEYPFDNFFKLELATSTFGLAAKISDVGSFFSTYTRQGYEKETLSDLTEDWWKDGSLPGTVTSLVRQRVNDVVIVVFIPTRDEDNWMDDNAFLTELVDATAVSVGL
jgi:CubicO group peptidase (beta-lactamase class C family)